MNYHAYLLRFWRDEGHAIWHASLEDPHTGEVFRFATAEQLYRFLNNLIGAPAGDHQTGKADSPEK